MTSSLEYADTKRFHCQMLEEDHFFSPDFGYEKRKKIFNQFHSVYVGDFYVQTEGIKKE